MAIQFDPLIRDTEGAKLIGGSRATWWRRVADGTLPHPVRIGGMSRWPLSEIEAVIDAAKAARQLPENTRVLLEDPSGSREAREIAAPTELVGKNVATVAAK